MWLRYIDLLLLEAQGSPDRMVDVLCEEVARCAGFALFSQGAGSDSIPEFFIEGSLLSEGGSLNRLLRATQISPTGSPGGDRAPIHSLGSRRRIDN